MRILTSLFVLLFSISALSVLSPSTASAQWPKLKDAPAVEKTGKNDVAIIVAVEDYLLLPDIPGAIANANEWEIFFQNGLKVPNIHVLINQDATREEMLKFAKTATEDVGPDGTIWWVFIGHGAPSVDGKDGLLVGMDAQQSVDSLTTRGLPQQELLTALGADKNNTVVVVDACFSGQSSDGKALATGVQPVIALKANASLGPKSILLSAAKSTEVAGQLDGAARPAFSYLLLGALRGWADDGDGNVTAKEALSFARRELRGVKGRQQTPQGEGNLSLVLAKGAKEKEPQAIADGVEAAEVCPNGSVLRDGKCEVQQQTSTGGDGKAELTLEYLRRRVTYDGKTPFQGTKVLEGAEFYHAINRPDLAEKWMGHNPWLWVPGMLLTAGGVALLVVGMGKAAGEEDSTAWFLGGFFGGFLTMSGGIVMITFGFITDKHPMKLSERKSAALAHNKKLQKERGLGPEVDSQNPPPRAPKKGMFNIFGSNGLPSAPSVNVTIRF